MTPDASGTAPSTSRSVAMPYADQRLDIHGPNGPLKIIVTGAALKAVGGHFSSPADAAFEMNKHMEMFASIALAKQAESQTSNDVVKIAAHDVRGMHPKVVDLRP